MEPDQAISGENKEQLDVDVERDAAKTAEPAPATDSNDYPAGVVLGLIVAALAMSMFLVALDMVSYNKSFSIHTLVLLPFH